MANDTTALAQGFAPASDADWHGLVDKALKGEPFDTLISKTEDGLALAPLYEAGTEPAIAGRANVRWRVVQRADHPDPAAASEQIQTDLENGATDIALVIHDGASAHGYGLPATREALAAALSGVGTDGIGLRLEPHPKARTTAAMLADVLADMGAAPAATKVRFGFDPVGNLARWGVMEATDTVATRFAEAIADLKARGYAGPFAEADGRPYHNAGATAATELAAILATAVQYLRFGAAPEDIGFTLAVDVDQFEGIAKIRALRLLWARVLEVSGLAPVKALIHAETSWRMMTRMDPDTNMLRATIAAFAAGVGGADSIAVLPYSAALGLPDAFARRIARNTQLVLAEESNLWRVADPAAGSGAVEAMTEALAAAAWTDFQAIEADGGIVASLTDGTLPGRIAEARASRDAAYAEKSRIIIGTNIYPDPNPARAETLDVAPWPEPAFKPHPVTCTPLAPARIAGQFENAPAQS